MSEAGFTFAESFEEYEARTGHSRQEWREEAHAAHDMLRHRLRPLVQTGRDTWERKGIYDRG